MVAFRVLPRAPVPSPVTRRTHRGVLLSAECWGDGDQEFFRAAQGRPGARGFLVTIAKANHNYFNTEWTTGPAPADGDDTDCPGATGRPSAAAQQHLAVTYLRAFYAYALKGDARGMPVLTGKSPVSGVTTRVETFG